MGTAHEPNAHAGASRSARDTQGPAQRDPPPNSVGGGAGRGRQGSPPPHGGRAPPSPTVAEERGQCPTARRVSRTSTRKSGGAATGGSGTPRLPRGLLEKAFSPRAHHPRPGVKCPAGRPRGGGVLRWKRKRVREVEGGRWAEGPAATAGVPRTPPSSAALAPSEPSRHPPRGSTPPTRQPPAAGNAPRKHSQAGDGR